MLLNLVYPFALADDQAGLWSAQQFVAGEADQIDAGGDHLLRHRFVRQAVGGQVDQRAGAQIGGHRQARSRASSTSCASFTLLAKPWIA